MVGRYFRCGRDADASDGDVCFIVFHFLIFKLSLTCDESQETGEGIWSGNRPNPFLVLHSSPLREQETCDFLRYKMHSGAWKPRPYTGYATKEVRKLESLRYESVFS